MGEFVLAFVIFAVVVVVTAILFGGWIIVNVAKGLGLLLGIGPHHSTSQQKSRAAVGTRQVIQCRVPGCKHLNPAGARFCRHCGHAFPKMQVQAA